VAPSERLKKHLFRDVDEIEFKRLFVVHWLAAMEAANYQNNCSNGWKNHSIPVEDAKDLADKAWDEWNDKIGVLT
jgi:hypothetical protein